LTGLEQDQARLGADQAIPDKEDSFILEQHHPDDHAPRCVGTAPPAHAAVMLDCYT
jgi:hypothetical protein